MEKLSIKKLVDNEFMKEVSDITLYQDIEQLQYIGLISLIKSSITFSKHTHGYSVIVSFKDDLFCIFSSVKSIKFWANGCSHQYELQD